MVLAHLGVREAEHHFVNSVLRVPIPINEMDLLIFGLGNFYGFWVCGLECAGRREIFRSKNGRATR